MFNTKVIQQFLLASSLFDCLATLDPLSENDETLAPLKKYANFKAVYLSRCLKTGETPVAGQMDNEVTLNLWHLSRRSSLFAPSTPSIRYLLTPVAKPAL